MKATSEFKVNQSAPSLINVCIDQVQQGEIQGRIYHYYQKEAVPFSTVVEMLRQGEKLFDFIAFPQASTKTRSLIEKEVSARGAVMVRPEKQVAPETIMANKGELGTFIINVKFRQNAEWQGEAFWVEEDEKMFFSNTLELIKKIDKALQKIKK